MSRQHTSDNDTPPFSSKFTEGERPASAHVSAHHESPSSTHGPLTELALARSLANVDVRPDFEHEPKDFQPFDEDADSSSADNRDLEKDHSYRDSAGSSSLAPTAKAYDPTQLLELPPQRGPRLYRDFRWRFFTVYRKIYTVVFLLNLLWGVVGFYFAGFGDSVYDSGKLASDSVASAVAVNVMVGIAVRNEHVINILFSTFIATPHWTPLWLRRSCAMIYSYGGFHSGCTTASAAWYAIYTGVAIREYTSGRQPSPVFVILSSILLSLFVGIIILALPNLRQKYHNHFEGMHRFAGWTVLGIFWAQLISSAILGGRMMNKAPGIVLITSSAFWFLTTATLFVIYPWARLRKYPIEVDSLSNHAIRIHFAFGRPALCSAIRIADRPLVENHSFATIPRQDGKPGFSVVISSAGDWTRRVISTPPRSLYVRSGPNQGMAAVTRLFSPVVLIATGSGIGPCLGFFVGRPGHDVRVIWSTKNPLSTYGPAVLDMVTAADPHARIIDTDKTGRPDIVKLAYTAYREAGAEAVCIVSNKKVVDMVVFEMESRGVPAYGPIWDS
ncbi:amino acid adenylation domain-containing protein [Diplodia corticola]|uniref:Amino acid adenylation domain-containing protein n=1 Tax=Diplodia corticola TaxID=236234 RepID=A0A1J9QYE6_9PEZI|nr:amino acid adenylation domain-containing protein [Diplodia corticola]OJD33401.1 amino acid adenylation domain-containing protein [Diplodia corticola]